MAKKKKASQPSSRERRRQRRVRNQILVYMALCVVIVSAAVGLFFAGRFVTRWIADRHQNDESAEEAAGGEETEEEAEATEEEPIEEYTKDDLREEMIDASIAEMSLEDRVAGMFLTTPEVLTGTDVATMAGEGTEAALSEYPVGGIVYHASNVQSEEQFAQMITDTIPKSKYHLFFILEDTSEVLTADLSTYGINMEFEEKGEDSSSPFRTAVLPSLLGDASEEGLVTVWITGEEEALADACMEAWENGANLLYVEDGFQSAYEGMLEEIRGNPEQESRVEDTIKAIYRVKYRNGVEE